MWPVNKYFIFQFFYQSLDVLLKCYSHSSNNNIVDQLVLFWLGFGSLLSLSQILEIMLADSLQSNCLHLCSLLQFFSVIILLDVIHTLYMCFFFLWKHLMNHSPAHGVFLDYFILLDLLAFWMFSYTVAPSAQAFKYALANYGFLIWWVRSSLWPVFLSCLTCLHHS